MKVFTLITITILLTACGGGGGTKTVTVTKEGPERVKEIPVDRIVEVTPEPKTNLEIASEALKSLRKFYSLTPFNAVGAWAYNDANSIFKHKNSKEIIKARLDMVVLTQAAKDWFKEITGAEFVVNDIFGQDYATTARVLAMFKYFDEAEELEKGYNDAQKVAIFLYLSTANSNTTQSLNDMASEVDFDGVATYTCRKKSYAFITERPCVVFTLNGLNVVELEDEQFNYSDVSPYTLEGQGIKKGDFVRVSIGYTVVKSTSTEGCVFKADGTLWGNDCNYKVTVRDKESNEFGLWEKFGTITDVAVFTKCNDYAEFADSFGTRLANKPAKPGSISRDIRNWGDISSYANKTLKHTYIELLNINPFSDVTIRRFTQQSLSSEKVGVQLETGNSFRRHITFRYNSTKISFGTGDFVTARIAAYTQPYRLFAQAIIHIAGGDISESLTDAFALESPVTEEDGIAECREAKDDLGI